MRPWHGILGGVVMTLLMTGCAGESAKPVATASGGTAAANTTEVFDPSAYRFDSGDKVRLLVYGEEQLSGEFQIDGKGDLSLPLIGTINAKNATARELEQRIAAKLSEGYIVDPRVSIEVLNYRPFYIIGEVRNPGNYPYVSGMTIINAVAMAGGYTYRGRTNSAVIKRAKTPEREETVPTSTGVMPGDVIIIKERYF
jgi:polysaccharide biosynthesis/export protein